MTEQGAQDHSPTAVKFKDTIRGNASSYRELIRRRTHDEVDPEQLRGHQVSAAVIFFVGGQQDWGVSLLLRDHVSASSIISEANLSRPAMWTQMQNPLWRALKT